MKVRKNTFSTIFLVFTFIILLTMPIFSVYAAKPERITNLGTLPDGITSYAYGINDMGQVVGSSAVVGTFKAFLWTAKDGMTELETPGDSDFSRALDINIKGTVVGYSGIYIPHPIGGGFNYPLYQHAVMWTAEGEMAILEDLDGTDASVATGINKLGQVVGYSVNYVEEEESIVGWDYYHAVMWTAEGEIIDLGVLEGGTRSWAMGINDMGQVVGSSVVDHSKAFLWTAKDGMTELLTPETPEGYITFATGINNRGQIVGRLVNNLLTPAFNQAVMWNAKGEMTILGTLDDYPASTASDINDIGQVVGYCTGDTILDHQTFLWTPKGGMIELEPLEGDTRSTATSINNAGQVVGESAFKAVIWNIKGLK